MYIWLPIKINLFYLTCLLLWISPNMRKHNVFCVRVKKCLIAAFIKINSSWTLVLPSTLSHLSQTLLIWVWIIIVELRLQTQKSLLVLFWLNMKSLILKKKLLKLVCQNYGQYIVFLVCRCISSLLDKFFSLDWEWKATKVIPLFVISLLILFYQLLTTFGATSRL